MTYYEMDIIYENLVPGFACIKKHLLFMLSAAEQNEKYEKLELCLALIWIDFHCTWPFGFLCIYIMYFFILSGL